MLSHVPIEVTPGTSFCEDLILFNHNFTVSKDVILTVFNELCMAKF